MDKATQNLVRASLRIVPAQVVVRRLPPLVNAERLFGNKSKIYGDAGMLSGEVNEWLEGDCTGKRGIVNNKLWGDWTYVTGDISGIYGLATATSGNATGKSGDISGGYGDFSDWLGEMSGIRGYYTGIGGNATGVVATIDEIKEALKGGWQ